MTFVVGASAHGSPGVSTALALVASQWPQSPNVPVVVEADRSGGVLAARYEISLTPGVVTLAESLRKFETPPLLDHAQRLPSGVACLPISPSASAAGTQLRSAAGYLGPYLRESGHPVLLDAGTLLPDSKLTATVRSAEQLLWFVRPLREELLVLRHRLAECPQPDDVAIVLVGETPYGAAQVEDALEVPVVHVLPIDQRGARAANLGGDDRFLRRSPLARSCARLAEVLRERMWQAIMRSDDDTDTEHRLDDLAPASQPPKVPASSQRTSPGPAEPEPDSATVDHAKPGSPASTGPAVAASGGSPEPEGTVVWRPMAEARTQPVGPSEAVVDDEAPVVWRAASASSETVSTPDDVAPHVWRAPVDGLGSDDGAEPGDVRDDATADDVRDDAELVDVRDGATADAARQGATGGAVPGVVVWTSD